MGGGLRSDTGLSSLSLVNLGNSVDLAEQSGWGVSGQWGNEDSEHRYLSRSLVAECSKKGVAGGESRGQVHFTLFCFYDIWMWMRDSTVQEAEHVEAGSHLYSELPEKGGGKGMLCTEGSNLILVTRETESLSADEEAAWFGGSKLKCSLLLISHLR